MNSVAKRHTSTYTRTMAAYVPISGGTSTRTRSTSVKTRLMALAASVALSTLSLFGCQLVAGDFEIKESKTEQQGLCKAGEFRCNGEYLLTCAADSSDWMLDQVCPTADLCDSKLEQCRVCGIGDQRCDGASREECNEDGTAWVQIERCDSDAMCNPTFCGNCTAGEFACRGTGETVDRELWECGPGNVWSMPLDTCETAGICSASLDMAHTDPNWSKTCLEPVCDEPGSFRCEGQELRRCRQDRTAWDVIDTCASVALCEQGVQNATVSKGLVDMCPLGCLSPGMFVCEDQALTRCRDDLTGYDFVMACDAGTDCNPQQGSCSELCTEGDYQCNGAQLRRCKADQTWEEVKRCASPVLCFTSYEGDRPTSGDCTEPACEPAGGFMCEGAALYECRLDLSAWDTFDTCHSADLCSAADKRCNEPVCLPGEFRCFDSANGTVELRECSPGLTGWNVVDTCGAGQFCSNDATDPGCKLECPSPTRCNGAELERCTPNGWVHQANCATNELCSCTLNDGCTLGLFTDGCGTPVCGGTQAGYQCTGATLQKCQAGRNGWDDAQTCGSAALCYPGAAPAFTNGYCATCPTAGEVRCATVGTGTRLETCSADRKTWNASQTCGVSGCVDSGSMDYCAICNSGQVQCSAATLQRCGTDRRSWIETMCMSAALCDAAGNQCDICMPNSNRCDARVLHHCSSDGQRDQTQTCANLCDQTNGECDACMPSTSRCSNNVLLTCSTNGQTETPTNCATAALCNATAQRCDAPVCGVGETRCVGAQPQVCNANRNGWDSAGTACATAALCVAASGTCTAPTCAVGQTRCSGAQPQVCNANRNGWDSQGTACASAALCVAATGACTAPTCASGQIRCSGAQPQVCNANRNGWDNMGTLCASSALCNAMTGTCTAPTCSANQTRCVGVQPQVCRGDLTGYQDTGTACATAALCNAASGSCTTPACAVGEKRCNGAQPQICNADRTGFQSDGMACATAALCNTTTGTCTAPTCSPGQTRCMGAQPQVCNAGQNGWNPQGSACATAALCDAASGSCNPAACMSGDTRCNGAQPEVCNAGQTGWNSMGTACATAALCVAATGTCTNPTCSPNQRRCMGAQPQVCNANQNGWDPSGSPCATAGLCSAGMCSPPVCGANEPRCVGAQPQICNDDRTDWENNGAACASVPLCVEGACTPPTCAANEYRCVGTSRQVCNATFNGFREVDVCASAALCTMSTGATCMDPACAATDWRCAGPNLQQCRADLTGFANMMMCASPALCDAAGHECDDCVPPDFQCLTTPNMLQSCTSAGHWMDEMDCGDGTCDPEAGMCIAPP